ncbi:unnamed protein product, partial [marine sediment metagenome]
YSIKSDVRIIAASNKDLAMLVKENNFREDLFYRLSVFPVTIPSLKERIDDIPLLVGHILKKMKSSKKISPQAIEKLKEYDWPGNIRELENTIERADIITKKMIQPEHILLPLRELGKTLIEFPRTLRAAAEKGRELAEAEIIKRTLDEVAGNKSEAARRLGVSYKTLLNRIKRYKDKGLL